MAKLSSLKNLTKPAPFFISHNLPSVTKIIKQSLPKAKKVIFICDRRFKASKSIEHLYQHPLAVFCFVPSGEKTKSVENLSQILQKIIKLSDGVSKKELLLVSLGGGSIGDLTGFIASVYKRGVSFAHIPTSLLSSIDAAHGGKNALNFKDVKNVVGSIYMPQAVFIAKTIVPFHDSKQQNEALGELIKIALICGGSLYQLVKSQTHKARLFQQAMEPAITCKNKIVAQDPLEKLGLRYQLNLGHSLGHVLESFYKISHGEAVLRGMLFTLEWSFYKKYIRSNLYQEVKELLLSQYPLKKIKPMSKSQMSYFLKQDKKRQTGSNLTFLFIKKPGDVFSENVSLKNLFQEAKRQGLII